MNKENIQIIKIDTAKWDKIKSRNTFELVQNIDKDKKVVFALDNYLYGYFDCYKVSDKYYQVKSVDNQFKIYCYNLYEELREDKQKVESLFLSRTKKQEILRLKIIIEKNHLDYLWCPGTEEIISQARIEIDDKLINRLKTNWDFQNKKQMFFCYQSLLPYTLKMRLKKCQLLVLEIENKEGASLPYFSLPLFFDGKNHLGEKIKFLFSFDFVDKKTETLTCNPKSISLMSNLYLSHEDMIEETNKIYKYLSFANLDSKIKHIQSELKIADFLFECQQAEYIHYSGHAKKEGVIFSDGVLDPALWLTLNKLPKVMIFSCCEFLENDLALKLIKKGVMMILTFEGVVDSTKACSFIKDLYWQWANAGLSFLDALHVIFKKYLNKEKLTFYPKLYGEGRIYLKR